MRRGTRPALGFTLLELIVVISIIGLLGVVLAERVQRYAEFAEKSSMEYTANIVNSGLLFEFAHRLTQGGRGSMAELVKINPVQWLAQKPTNYLGEYRDPPTGGEYAGNWYYDMQRNELVYLVKRDDNFQPGTDGKKHVRYHVALLYDEKDKDGAKGLLGAILTPVERYKWFAESGSRPDS